MKKCILIEVKDVDEKGKFGKTYCNICCDYDEMMNNDPAMFKFLIEEYINRGSK